MEAIKILIPMAIGMGIVFVGLFIWSTKSGQYDDLDTPSRRILLDDENDKINNTNKNNLTHERKDV
jgi:cbb3-type cytochrome oxidase maturation protein